MNELLSSKHKLTTMIQGQRNAISLIGEEAVIAFDFHVSFHQPSDFDIYAVFMSAQDVVVQQLSLTQQKEIEKIKADPISRLDYFNPHLFLKLYLQPMPKNITKVIFYLSLKESWQNRGIEHCQLQCTVQKPSLADERYLFDFAACHFGEQTKFISIYELYQKGDHWRLYASAESRSIPLKEVVTGFSENQQDATTIREAHYQSAPTFWHFPSEEEV
jgi:hypothetical protein